MDITELAELCQTPFGMSKPTLFRGVFDNPEGFFGEARIQRMLDDPRLVTRAGIFRDQQLIGDTSGYTREFIEEERAGGAVLTLRGVQRLPGPVRDICVALMDTGWPTVHGVALESPAGVISLKPHWDLNPVIAIQTKGHKRWLVYKPVVSDARSVITRWYDGHGAGFTGAEMEAMTPDRAADDVVLGPGDVYFVPAGWVHAPQAVDGSSLHVSICPLPQEVVDKSGNEDHFL